MTPEMKTKILDLLKHHNNMTIATNRADGYPQATTVGYASDGLTIYFGCGTQSQKAHNLARDSRVSAAIDHDCEDWNQIAGLSLAGTAAPVSDADELTKVGTLFVAKFPQIAGFGPEAMAGMTIYRLTPCVISVLDYTKGFGHSDLVTV